jgi:hypothetical protein
MPGIRLRIQALERWQPSESLQAVLLNVGETEAEAVARTGLPPGTPMFFIRLVAPDRDAQGNWQLSQK